MHYGFAIDLKRCIGCHTCSVACRYENNLPAHTWWNRILTDGGACPDVPAGSFPDLKMRQFPIACQHCDNPACVKVCPVGATYKDPKTGVVRQDYDKCIGCRMCMRHGRGRHPRASETCGGEVHDVLASHRER